MIRGQSIKYTNRISSRVRTRGPYPCTRPDRLVSRRRENDDLNKVFVRTLDTDRSRSVDPENGYDVKKKKKNSDSE